MDTPPTTRPLTTAEQREQDDVQSRITYDQEQEAAAERRDRFRDEYEGQDDA